MKIRFALTLTFLSFVAGPALANIVPPGGAGRASAVVGEMGLTVTEETPVYFGSFFASKFEEKQVWTDSTLSDRITYVERGHYGIVKVTGEVNRAVTLSVSDSITLHGGGETMEAELESRQDTLVLGAEGTVFEISGKLIVARNQKPASYVGTYNIDAHYE